ncbi:MAG: transposase family protein, partial [Pseudonocardiaceae bacterium]
MFWARPGSGFTMLFETLALTFAAAMPVAKVAEITREHDTRIWRVLKHPVTATRDQEDFSSLSEFPCKQRMTDTVIVNLILSQRKPPWEEDSQCVQGHFPAR